VRRIINHRHFVKYEKYVSLIIWLLAIFYLSSQSLDFVAVTDVWEFIIRKLAHMFEYGVLTYLIFRILGQTEKRHVNWNLFWSLAFSVLYALSDEYHQSFVVGRVGVIRDVVIDSIGSLIFIWLIYLNYHHQHRKIK
jgi:VanZ family protein